ncbi:MAG: hypothetical protein DSY43_04460 [Gammaproteobacteria bacterium]|nr:MAG: hypothetical protein DSY43_04460 [Gammaproteobacteria bacterium]
MEDKVIESQNKTQFTLNEEDIPGAKLLKPPEECNCSVLRRWLLCRGAKTSGKLADLRLRYDRVVYMYMC